MLYNDMPARSRCVPIDKDIAREKLILAGERLIAQQGLEGLSLRKVNLAAGQKNTSAALYHFVTNMASCSLFLTTDWNT